MREKLEEKFLRTVRFYTFHTPLRKGKFRLYQTALKLCKTLPRSLPAQLSDGRRFVINLATGMQEPAYFVGEFERVLTEIARRLVNEGDICVDAGANFGWYTTLMATRCGPNGVVHAFEPAPQAFADLQRNHVLIGSPANIVVNNVALGDHAGTVQIHVSEGLSGYASLAGDQDGNAAVVDCPMITLDSYLEAKEVGEVRFVKVDIEGAELMFLRGARRLFDQATPPVILMEMATGQAANFGYHPNELIDFIRTRARYDFYAIDEYEGTARVITEFGAGDIGANVFCIPHGRNRASSVLREYLV